MKSSDPKALWSKINWKGECKEDVTDESPDIEDLAKQFKSKDSDSADHFLDIDYGDTTVPELDGDVKIEEIDNAESIISKHVA